MRKVYITLTIVNVTLSCFLLFGGEILGVFTVPTQAAPAPTEIVCDPDEVIALHEKEPIYPAWEYHCSSGQVVVILD